MYVPTFRFLVLQPYPNASLVGVGEAEWAFKTTFNVTERELASQNVDLVFDGLDTFANIALVRISHQREKCPLIILINNRTAVLSLSAS